MVVTGWLWSTRCHRSLFGGGPGSLWPLSGGSPSWAWLGMVELVTWHRQNCQWKNPIWLSTTYTYTAALIEIWETAWAKHSKLKKNNNKQKQEADQFVPWINIVEDPAVLHGALHSTGPQGLGHRGQRNNPLSSTLCQHVTLHLLATWLCHVGTVVHHKDRLVRHREHLRFANLQCALIWKGNRKLHQRKLWVNLSHSNYKVIFKCLICSLKPVLNPLNTWRK